MHFIVHNSSFIQSADRVQATKTHPFILCNFSFAPVIIQLSFHVLYIPYVTLYNGWLCCFGFYEDILGLDWENQQLCLSTCQLVVEANCLCLADFTVRHLFMYALVILFIHVLCSVEWIIICLFVVASLDVLWDFAAVRCVKYLNFIAYPMQTEFTTAVLLTHFSHLAYCLCLP